MIYSLPAKKKCKMSEKRSEQHDECSVRVRYRRDVTELRWVVEESFDGVVSIVVFTSTFVFRDERCL